MVSSERLMQGLMMFVSKMADSASVKKKDLTWAWAMKVAFNSQRQSLQAFFNCKNESINRFNEGEPMGPRGYRMAAAQNVFEFLQPTEF